MAVSVAHTPSSEGFQSYRSMNSSSTSQTSLDDPDVSCSKCQNIFSQDHSVLVTHSSQRWMIKVTLEEKLLISAAISSFPAYLSRLESDPSWGDIDLTLQPVFAAAFLDHISSSKDISENAQQTVLEAFKHDILADKDIHEAVKGLNDDCASFLVKSFLRSLESIGFPYPTRESALITSASQHGGKLHAIFGGQGINSLTCLNELRHLYLVYRPLIRELIDIATSTLDRLISKPETSAYYEMCGLNIKRLLERPYIEIDSAYIASAPISVPIIGLISLCHYCIACRILGMSPGDLRGLLKSVTGHSQGAIVADAVARSGSWEEFYAASEVAMELLFWIGFESHQANSFSPLSYGEIRESIELGEEQPSPMLAIRGLDDVTVDRILAKVNNGLPVEDHASIALVNARENVTVAGPPRTLRGMSKQLRKLRFSTEVDQSRILFNKRKPVIEHQFLPISAPFHTPHLENATSRILAALRGKKLPARELSVCFYHTKTGEDISRMDSSDITEMLVRMVTVDKVDWPKTVSHMDHSHVLDFGPGNIGSLVYKLQEGTGTRVVMVSKLCSKSARVGAKGELFASTMPPLAPDWQAIYRPCLKSGIGGRKELVTRMTTCMGVPPIMVGGMTPTTVPWDFVTVIMQAGYHVEFAGGGYYNAKDMETSIRRIAQNIPTGRGITVNLIYANPRAMRWQIPLIRRLVQQGLPIDGLTIGAGVPSAETAREYIETMGLKHISFKPGSKQAIFEVLSIAKAFPNFTIGLQWTGGRGGGHHSFEDFHDPILRTYAAIRECPNVVLIAGSGFGNAEETFPYLTGEWSRAFGYPPMPVDGILLGSRMMVAKEAHTSEEAKRLIAEAPGVLDTEWHTSYDRPTGGILTVNSEMGQPIHKLATRGVILWHELDKKIFSIKDASKRLSEIRKNRLSIIDRLNRDFQKPWFGVNRDGNNVDVEDMTYSEVVSRLISLMYVKDHGKWIDHSYERLLFDFIRRVRERLPQVATLNVTPGCNPEELLVAFSQSYPSAESELLHPDDVSFFLGLCQRRGQKPVNFIPILDENFEQWFKKDSLWQAENVESVVGRDVQRVCVIHGPVAARHSRTTNESCQKILDGILNPLIDMFDRESNTSAEIYTQTSMLVQPPKPFIAGGNLPSSSLKGMSIQESEQQRILNFSASENLPEVQAFTQYLRESTDGWIQACLTDLVIMQGSQRRPNPVRAAISPQDGYMIVFKYTPNGDIEEATLYKNTETLRTPRLLMRLSCSDGQNIFLRIHEPSPRTGKDVSLQLSFQYLPSGYSCRIVEDLSWRNERIKNFYSELWLGTSLGPLSKAGVHREFATGMIRIERPLVRDFMAVIASSDPDQVFQGLPRDVVPMDYCIVLAWDAIVQPLLISGTSGDLLKLLHRSNQFTYCPDVEPLRFGDSVQTIARIGSITNQQNGKLIEVMAEIRRSDKPVVMVTSTFFIRGSFDDSERTFSCIKEPEMEIFIESERDAALLLSRTWLELYSSPTELIGAKLVFKLVTQATYDQEGSFASLQVSGQIHRKEVSRKTEEVGKVYFETGPCYGNPVIDFLERHGSCVREPKPLQNPGWKLGSVMKLKIPKDPSFYARVSKDCNPIHLSPSFARYVGLSGTVTHGMFTSAAIRNVVERVVAESDPSRFHRWLAHFEDIVQPGDVLRIEIRHESMIEGRMVIKAIAYNDCTGAKVLEAEAEIDQAPTAYIFTGQGSQEKAMGMSLYNSSPAARNAWDRGDKHLMDHYGFSIRHIVCNDPKELTVYFGGVRGRRLRDNYLSMTTRKIAPNGDIVEECIIPGLTSTSASYTFREERGLLYSTQFAQPAIVLMELAAFEDIKSKGLVQKNAPYAGHSLGEYTALGTIAGILSIESLLSLVFYRGLAMQMAMQRDEDGKTDFSMVAVNPSKLGKAFRQKDFENVVQLIGQESGVMLEVVNYNVEGQQYVCAGHLRALWVMTQVLNRLGQDSEMVSLNPNALNNIILDCVSEAPEETSGIHLERGIATIPLNGIDVPFHSTYLRDGISTYRTFLEDKILKEQVDPGKLEGKFIPNVMGKPFSVSREFVEDVALTTRSEIVRRLLDCMQ